MARDDTARHDGLRDADGSSAPDDPGPTSWPVWPRDEVDPSPPWPAYDAEAGRLDQVDDAVPAVLPRRRWAGVVAIVATSFVVAAAGAGVLLSRQRPADVAPQAARVQPMPMRPAGPQWTPDGLPPAAGLVRVEVTATVEADGIVMTDDGLVATSYARLAGLGGGDAMVNKVELDVVADGGLPMRAEIIGFDASRDVAVLRVPGFTPSSVARTGTPVKNGDALTLLDDLGEGQPVVGLPVTVTATGQQCWRSGAAMISRPEGFRFAVPIDSAEPGGAVVRDDGSVVGMYYGGDAEEAHCAVPIAEVAAIIRDVTADRQTATTRVGPPGGLGIQLINPSWAGADDTYPMVSSIQHFDALAHAAGVKEGDLLTRVGDTSLRKEDLTTLGPDGVIRSLEPGQQVTIEWQSDGTAHRATVEVGVGAQPNG